MGLLREIDDQICKPCRRGMDKGDEPHFCDEGCALYRLGTALDNFRNGTLRDALNLQERL